MGRADRFSAATFEDEQFSDSERAAGWHWEPRDRLLGADWFDRCGKRGSPRWGNHSWLTPRILLESLNDVVAKRFDDVVPFRRQRWMAQQRAAGLLPPDSRSAGTRPGDALVLTSLHGCSSLAEWVRSRVSRHRGRAPMDRRIQIGFMPLPDVDARGGQWGAEAAMASAREACSDSTWATPSRLNA